MAHPLPVEVVRLGHRPGRDDRMTTHVGLTARALGAAAVTLPEIASDAATTVREVTDRFGGPFTVRTAADPLGTLRDADAPIAHLTMYGEPIQETMPVIRDGLPEDSDPPALVVAVGAGKVPVEVYRAATWNVAVTNQPHSEIAALAVFLDRLFDGQELDKEFANADRRVVPQGAGKRVVDGDGDEGP